VDRAQLALLLGAPAGLVAEPPRAATVVTAGDPHRFMAEFATAVAQGGVVLLAAETWGENERRQLDVLRQQEQVTPATAAGRGWLCLPTGGTSGLLKFARHDEETIAAAVRGFARHFDVTQVNAAGVLPLHHVSGLMAWLRCALTGGEYRPLDWKAVEAGERPILPAKPGGWTISLVPTQLERLLGNPAAVEWLRGFRLVLLGGAPAWPALLDRAAAANLPLAPGYGMTETAAMVTALRPEEFLAGARSNGQTLPHATVQIGTDDTIILGGDSLFRGYHPAWRDRWDLETQDRGRLDDRKHLHVLGRRDAVIITGGEKVEPAEVDAVLRSTGQFPDLVVLGLPDARWGQLLVVVYPGSAHPDFHQVIRATNSLADYKRPKRYIPLTGPWPAGAQGKVNRAGLVERVAAQLKLRR